MALAIHDFLPYYPSIDDNNLQQIILNKAEFSELKLQSDVEPPIKGKLKQQILIQRYFSEHTPYDEGLIYHSMGTGKTCAAFALTESLKVSKLYKRCFVLARGDDSLDNLRKELAERCSDSYRDADDLKEIRRLVKDFYIFKTYYTFAKELANFSDDQIQQKYSESIFVVDEAHNIRFNASDKDTQTIYRELYRVFHVATSRKILLLTATPMRDDVNEISDIMNLLLPENKQLPTGKAFNDTFLTLNKDETYSINKTNEGLLKEYLRGRISFLSEAFNVPIVYQGASKDIDIPQFRSVDLEMSDFQTKWYRKAYEKDTQGEARSIYTNSIQASLFVFPDGSWGMDGLSRYANNKGYIDDNLKVEIKRRLKDFSIKYHSVIQTIQNNPRKNIYIYCSLVNGSGANLLAQILELYGYIRSNGTERTKGKRYILLTSETSQISRLVSYYNRSENMFGEYCQVIIGSRKIAEGFSFKNIQLELLLTLHWNETETSQASRRGARYGSWNALIQAGVQPTLYISKVCAIPRKDAESSIDKLMLSISRRKDISMKRMDRVIKEIAFDCPIAYERNVHKEAGDYSRECDYDICEYKCDLGDSKEGMSRDISTYELYYSNYIDIIEPILEIFATRDSLSFSFLCELIRPMENIQILKALSYIIDNNIPIINRYKNICYLREYMNVYFITSDVRTPNVLSSFDMYKPMFTSVQSLDSVINELEHAQTYSLLDEFSEMKDEKDFQQIVEKMPKYVIDILVKLALELNKNTTLTNYVKTYFKDVIRELPSKTLYKDTSENIWCLQNKKWAKCDLQFPTKKVDSKYIGILGEEDKFCIKRVDTKESVKDKRKKASGAVCVEAGWKKDELLKVAKELKIKATDEMTKKEICTIFQNWFKSKNLLERGKCGTARKRKD